MFFDVFYKFSSAIEPFSSACVRLKSLQVSKVNMQLAFTQFCSTRRQLTIEEWNNS